MRKTFSTHWQASRQIRKQRKYRANAPLHIRHRFLSAMLSKDLKKKYRKNAFPLRKGDSVVVMRGKFNKKDGKIKVINLKRLRVKIEGLYITKKDGTNVDVSFDPSKLMIKELNLEDKERIAALTRIGVKNAPKDKRNS